MLQKNAIFRVLKWLSTFTLVIPASFMVLFGAALRTVDRNNPGSVYVWASRSIPNIVDILSISLLVGGAILIFYNLFLRTHKWSDLLVNFTFGAPMWFSIGLTIGYILVEDGSLGTLFRYVFTYVCLALVYLFAALFDIWQEDIV